MKNQPVVFDGYSERAVAAVLGLSAPGARVAIVAGHPDDEAIGAGALMANLKEVLIIHITDGAAINPKAARARGFSTRTGYAGARLKELSAVLSLLPRRPETLCLGIPDLEASYNLVYIARMLTEILKRFNPGAVITHPYECGHPDHDSAAFAVREAACALGLEGQAPEIREFASYNGCRGRRMLTGEFIPGAKGEVAVRLNEGERALKKGMYSAYRTQEKALGQFSIDTERFRPAPEYDFCSRPHFGKAFYDRFDWGIKWSDWSVLAMKADHILRG